MAAAPDLDTETPTVASTARLGARLAAVVAALLAGLVVWVVAGPLVGVDLAVARGGDTGKTVELGVAAVVMMSLVAALAGWGLLALLERFAASRARMAWTVTAAVALLISLVGPLDQATNTGARIALLAMHLAVGLAVIVLLRRTSADPRPVRS